MKITRFLNKFAGSRPGLCIFLAAALVLLATMISPAPPPPPAGPADARLDVVPVPLDEQDPGRRRVGGLTFLRGWALSSDEPRFGGISAMQVELGQVTALSDTGVLFRFPLPRSAGAVPLRVEALPQAGDGPKSGHDTEAMWLAGARAWIAFERGNAVVRFRRDGWREEAAARPAPMQRWRGNSGPEALVRLADGRFLVLAEGRDNDAPFSPAILFDGDPAESATPVLVLSYRRQPGFRVTDAALLPDGRLLILNRRFDWLAGAAVRLVVADVPGPGAGATIEGRVIAELRAPLIVDNMEALSVVSEGGRTIVRLASDNNYMRVQRTLLLEFALE